MFHCQNVSHSHVRVQWKKKDISYCKPGRTDTVYCGKLNRSDKIYKSKYYLLWIIQAMAELFNIESLLEKCHTM